MKIGLSMLKSKKWYFTMFGSTTDNCIMSSPWPNPSDPSNSTESSQIRPNPTKFNQIRPNSAQSIQMQHFWIELIWIWLNWYGFGWIGLNLDEFGWIWSDLAGFNQRFLVKFIFRQRFHLVEFIQIHQIHSNPISNELSWIWLNWAGFGWIGLDLVEFGWIWLNLVKRKTLCNRQYQPILWWNFKMKSTLYFCK